MSLLRSLLTAVHPSQGSPDTMAGDLLLTLTSTAQEFGRCIWLCSRHKHLGWCSGIRTSSLYLSPDLEKLETDWELWNTGQNQKTSREAVSSCSPTCTTQPVNPYLKAQQNCPDKTDILLSLCIPPPLITSVAENLLTELRSITCWIFTSFTLSCWEGWGRTTGCVLHSGQVAWKWLKLLRTQPLLCSSNDFYRNHKSRLASRRTREHLYKYVPGLSGAAVCSSHAVDSLILTQEQRALKKQILAVS